MHDGREELGQWGEFSSIVAKLLEQLSESWEIFGVIVCLDSGILHFFFKFAERVSVGAFASLQEP